MVMPAMRRRWTTADVRALTSEQRAWPRYELIAGELVATPAPSAIHQIAVSEILMTLSDYLAREPIGLAVASPSDLELHPGTITQPDVFVIPADLPLRREQLQWSDVRSLLLAVEVLSPSSVRVDRVVKRDFYLDAGVRDYWIVDLDARVVERWATERETPEIRRDRVTWPASAGNPLVVDLPRLFDAVERKARLFRPA